MGVSHAQAAQWRSYLRLLHRSLLVQFHLHRHRRFWFGLSRRRLRSMLRSRRC